MKRSIGIAVICVLAIAAAGCGGGKKSSSATTSSSVTTSSTSTSSSSSSTTSTSSSSSSSSSFGSSKNCQQLLTLGQKMSQAMAAATSGGGGIQAEAKALQSAANSAPSEIRDDLKTIAGALGTYSDALKKSGYTPGTTPTAAQIAAIATAAKSLGGAKLQAAVAHLEAWGKKNCGALTTTG